ncbi:MAG: hypothetical protein HC932_04645 [Thermales bacterium]|nr:hypothetical protein [Thermales bacterium]
MKFNKITIGFIFVFSIVITNLFLFNEKNHVNYIINNVAHNWYLDTDKDGLSDRNEFYVYMTSPYTLDTDKDGFNDYIEVLNCYNPVDYSQGKLLFYESTLWRELARIYGIEGEILEQLDADGISSKCEENNVKIRWY